MDIAMKIKKIRKLYSGVIKPVDIIAGVIILSFCFFTMYYADITVTCQFGITFLDSLFDGKILSFYANALAAGIAPEGAVYDIGTYVVFGIWGIPIWLLQKTVGISVLSVGSLLWFKFLLVIFLFGTVYFMVKIALQLGFSDHESAAISIIYILSSTVIMPVFVVAQYDILALFFLLLGIYCYLDRKEKQFFIWIAVSMTIKPLTGLVLLLMILLFEKRIVYIIVDLIKGSSLMLLCKAVYSFSPAYRESCSGFLQKKIVNMFSSSIAGSYSDISVFVVGLVIIYIVAYFYDNSLVFIKKSKIAMVLCFCIWALFCAVGSMTAYWTIYMAPFAVLTIFMNKKYIDKMLVLDILSNIMLTFLLINSYSWVYGGDKTFSYLILKKFCGKVLTGNQGTTVAGVLRRILPAGWYFAAAAGIMVACMIMIVYYSFKGIAEENQVSLEQAQVYRWHFRGRIFLYYIWAGLNLGALILTVTGH